MASIDNTEGFDDTTMEMLSANLPSSAFTTNTPDPRLEKARQEMERTNQITPLLKEELRLRILSKRLQKGEPEIEINSGEPRSYELTEEEQAKRERRKAQNRRAAKKCRAKRKMKTLSDAEKYRLIREQNQQLRNHVTYLRHKDDVYKKFCIDHILHQQCSSDPNDEASRRQLLALLGSNIGLDYRVHHQTEDLSASSTFGSVSGSHLHSTQPESTKSNSVGFHSSYDSQTSFATMPMSLPSSTDHHVFHTAQDVATMDELKELPVLEISSLLPPEPDFSVSDHSMESTPPELSPTSLFNTMSPTTAGTNLCGVASTSYFTQLTASTPYSGNNTSSFSSSNDGIFALSPAGKDMSTSFLDAHVSDMHQDMSVEFLHGEFHSENTILRNGLSGVSNDDLNSVTRFTTQDEKHCNHDNQNSYPVASCNNSTTDGHVFSVAVTNSVIVNTTFLNDLPAYLEPFLGNYLKVQQQAHSMTDNCSQDPVVQTVVISPLTPLSPPSPNLTFSPISPNTLSTETSRKESSALHIQSCTAGVSYDSSARPVVRRMSSTTSVPSPFYNHHMSITLSPPPSVPSPTSNGVPESPPILEHSSACTESAHIPHVSPFSGESSTDCSPVSFFEATEDEFN